MAKKPQTEAKAKGLVKNVGDYKGRTLNLTKKQVAKSGVKGAQRAASAKGTSISDTKFVQGKGVTVGGKLFTGNVDLGGGNIAVYVRGKRVRAKGAVDRSNIKKRTGPSGSDQSKDAGKPAVGKMGEKPGEYQAGRGMRSRAMPRPTGKRGMATPDRIDRPKSVPQSRWDSMSLAQKALVVAGAVSPNVLVNFPARTAAAALAGEKVGREIRKRIDSRQKPRVPLKMTKTSEYESKRRGAK
jgi:hypothetical protein